jgi:predicted AlkP superfamily pyrophosphatase or phosphodiesterase
VALIKLVTLGVGAACALGMASPVFAAKSKPAARSAAALVGAPKQGPKLIIAISVDQFSADLFAQYRSQFTGGFKRLAGGVVFPSGYQSQSATETCPGHSTILTGAHPSRSGIVANTWFDLGTAREDKKIYCAEDESVPGSTSDNYTVSPVHLKVPTLGDRLKAANSASRVVSVSGKDRAAVMMGGKATDEIWWWAARGFASYVGKKPPPVVEAINAQITEELPQPGLVGALAPVCSALVDPIKIGEEGVVGGSVLQREPGDARGFRATPALDQKTLALAQAFLKDMKLGSGAATDVLAIGLSGTDYVGHTFGTQGVEMCDQLMKLDTAMGQFFDAVDASGVAYIVVLTADHGGHDVPERNKQRAIPDAKRVDVALSPSQIDQAVTEALKLEGFFITGDSPFGDMYVPRDLAPAQRKAIIAKAREILLANSQVAAVFTGDELKTTPKPTLPADEWTLAQRVAAGFYEQRSGDFYVILKPRVTPIPEGAIGYVATHGSAWNYDRRVPILFWSKDLKGFEQPNPIESVDIMPTLASLIGLPVPASEIDGRCLDVIIGTESNCKP